MLKVITPKILLGQHKLIEVIGNTIIELLYKRSLM